MSYHTHFLSLTNPTLLPSGLSFLNPLQGPPPEVESSNNEKNHELRSGMVRRNEMQGNIFGVFCSP